MIRISAMIKKSPVNIRFVGFIAVDRERSIYALFSVFFFLPGPPPNASGDEVQPANNGEQLGCLKASFVSIRTLFYCVHITSKIFSDRVSLLPLFMDIDSYWA